MPGGVSRPAAAAAARIAAICSDACASGSPQIANVSACLPPTLNAAYDDPPK